MKETTKAKNDLFDLDTLLHPARRLRIQWMLFAIRILRSTRSAQCWLLGRQTVVPSKQLRSWSDCSGSLVAWDDIMDALRALDKEEICKPLPHYKRVRRKKA